MRGAVLTRIKLDVVSKYKILPSLHINSCMHMRACIARGLPGIPVHVDIHIVAEGTDAAITRRDDTPRKATRTAVAKNRCLVMLAPNPGPAGRPTCLTDGDSPKDSSARRYSLIAPRLRLAAALYRWP